MEEFINPKPETWKSIFARPSINVKSLEKSVSKIIDEVKNNGDKAVKSFIKEFDKAEIDQLMVSAEEIDNSENLIDSDLKEAIVKAAFNIEKFHVSQVSKVKKIETESGVVCWQKSVGIQKVGLYVPGGTAPLFSTVLMLAIPARIAGCKEVVLCTPSDMDGKVHPAVLFAAKITGVTSVFRVGGVQAIAAMAYGTESIPEVNKIFGPGNQYVTCAKQIVSRSKCAIDMPAGPSEVAVVADDTAIPEFVAADMLSQAEHGADSQALLFTNSKNLIVKVENAIERQLGELPRAELAKKSLENSKIIYFDDKNTLVDAVNAYAPEHLILSVSDYEEVAEKIINAGSVFLGNYTPESAGDYASGTNHTLPTNGWAVSFSGVNIDAFVKKITFQNISKKGIEKLGKVIVKMAESESLEAHANAARLRMKE